MESSESLAQILSEAPGIADGAYKLLLEKTDLAMAEGKFNKAFHLLAACTHLAQSEDAREVLSQIATIAKSYQKKIDAEFPGYELSTRSAEQRGRQGVFKLLSLTASAASRGTNSNKIVGREAST